MTKIMDEAAGFEREMDVLINNEKVCTVAVVGEGVEMDTRDAAADATAVIGLPEIVRYALRPPTVG